jgi:hypothetical protein
VCLSTARHRSAALVILKQAPITQSWAGTRRPFIIYFIKLGATTKRQHGVTALANGTTRAGPVSGAQPMSEASALAAANALGLAGELCLVLALCGSTEHNLFGRRVNSIS